MDFRKNVETKEAETKEAETKEVETAEQELEFVDNAKSINPAPKNSDQKVTKEEIKDAVKVSREGFIKALPKAPVFRFFLNSKSGLQVFGKSILLLLIPYAYLFLCGFIFDKMLQWYFMTEFIFISLMVFWGISIIFIIWACKRYVANVAKANKRRRNRKAE